MKVKDLIQQLLAMNPNGDVWLSIYEPNDSGDQDHYVVSCVVEYHDKDGSHVQIKGD